MSNFVEISEPSVMCFSDTIFKLYFPQQFLPNSVPSLKKSVLLI